MKCLGKDLWLGAIDLTRISISTFKAWGTQMLSYLLICI